MTDHPSTFQADTDKNAGIEWDDRASLHRTDDGGGVLDKGKGLRSGTFAQLIAHMMLLPEEERGQYYIDKMGDRKYSAAEVANLAKHPAYPG
ncbi:hypothetical protein [Qipengyuania spongiae]|uniref:Uncharacterized protein n=1 Tax=Qipengyuania spongiae TaxID=2909673 RepID=A0ABY5SWT7_9SPHN|nr:hypothetical protein [Qipengyuania spongiae]UVI39012.1 hypothetical protein L1F33_12340 [Qipengyuania spongiae]